MENELLQMPLGCAGIKKKKKKKTLAERNKIAAFQNRVVRKTNSCHGMGNTPQKKKIDQ